MEDVRTLESQVLAALRAGDASCPDVPQQAAGPDSSVAHLLDLAPEQTAPVSGPVSRTSRLSG